MANLVLFDIDNTLLEGDSDFEWGQFLCDNNLVNQDEYRKRNEVFYEQYLARKIDIHEYLSFSLEPLKQYSVEDWKQWRGKFVSQKIYPLIPLHNQKLVQEHQRRGDILALISATQQFITQPIADIFTIDHLIATKPEVIDGYFTGNIIGTPCFQDGKITCLQEWLDKNKPVYNASWFYSDSINDLPLLEFVDKPIVKNGDPDLLKIAAQREWDIYSV